ncbi:MAG TPA: pyridoxal phosphate-dependent aminotransferase [Candidatus Acidoferrales bacterium]|nr:pyridoxal phosphate-dependent aminotransferase [Candidatus Acidoferrales bacterium]
MFSRRTNWNLQPNRLSEALERRRSSGREILDLTASNPTQCGFAYDRRAILAALAEEKALSYDPQPKGLPAAREAVSAYYAARGDRVGVDDILLTASTSEAYSFAFRALCDPGDELLIPAPSYPLFDFLAEIDDVRLVRYPLIYDHGWQTDFHALEHAITSRTRGIIVVHPNNPTGHFCSAAEASRLVGICEARGIASIADEVFWDFRHTREPAPGVARPVSFAASSPALALTMSGLSKISGLPQMKAAWIVVSGPEEIKRKALGRLEVIADTFLSVSAPVQHGLAALLNLRHDFQRQVLARVSANLAELDRQVAQHPSCARLEAEAGWYAVLRVPATRTDEELAVHLLESAGVYVHPGHFYDFPSPGYLVFSLIAPEAVFAEGLSRVLALF